MPCKADCEQRQLLLVKEDKIAKLQQVMKWVNDLGNQEPHRHEEVKTKLGVVNSEIVKTMSEAGLLVNKLARGCRLCNHNE